jgi:sterol desaturase/sphingolipid hydroxylase (fatty acid hydroxylase superfamily)
MEKPFVSNSRESARMFKYDWMEPFSKVHFTVPLIIYIPIIIFFLYKSVLFISPWYFIPLLYLGGVFLWTLTEYILHRFLFHWIPKGKFGARMHFIFHGVHHDYPNDAMRLVMPPIMSVTLAVLFYFLFQLALGGTMVFPFFSGFVSGYLFYDISHYAIHHFNFKNKFMLKLKKHHMFHHYKDGNNGFGVSSNLWDKIFRTDF